MGLDFAGAHRESLHQGVEECVHVLHGSVGTKDLLSAPIRRAGDENPRKSLLGDGNPWVGLVVLQHDVVLRLILLDEGVFQQQSLPFGIDHGGLDVADLGDQHPHLGGVVVFVEIGGNAPFEVFGLTDINHLAILIEIAVHARLGGESGKNKLDFTFVLRAHRFPFR